MADKRRAEAMTGQRRGRGMAALNDKRKPSTADMQTTGSPIPSVVVGRLMSGATATVLLVEFPGNTRGPVRARTTVSLDTATLNRAVVTGQGVVLVFENGDPGLPIVIGMLSSGQPVTPFQELLVSPRAGTVDRLSGTAIEARMDGERMILEGKREVVLKCGEASITLRSDGKVLLRGAYVETYAKGVNRIKGASVKIN